MFNHQNYTKRIKILKTGDLDFGNCDNLKEK
jgi:hypothetical protein